MPPVNEVPKGLKRRKLKPSRHVTPVIRFWLQVNKNGPIHPVYGQCWLWTGTGCKRQTGRYGIIAISNKQVYAHIFSWELHNTFLTKGQCVLHKCDIRACVNPDHLFVGDHVANRLDCMLKERHSRGEMVNTARLTEEEVLEIRRLHKLGATVRELSEIYGPSSTIQKVVAGVTWRYLL